MKKIASIIFYSIGFSLGIIYIIVNFLPNFRLSEIGSLGLLGIISLFLYFGGILLSKYTNSVKPLKINLWIFLVLYLILFLTLTLFDPAWGRNGGFIPKWSTELWNRYLEHSFNIIPFKTIWGYMSSFDSLLSTRTIFFNLIGNFICLMPLGFFLPLLFPRQKNWKVFLLTTVLFAVMIEGLQFLTLSGSCDIDDVILNVLGAFIMYQVLKIPALQNMIHNIFFLEKNKIDKKLLVKIGSLFLLIIALLYLIFQYREFLYQENLKKIGNQNSYNIKIIDESTTCADALEPFYEDQLYIYNFSCIKSDSVYALINDKKYLVKELLNDHNEYSITIDYLKLSVLEFIKENKYEMVVVEEKGSSYQVIVDQGLLEIKIPNVQYNDDKIYFELHFIPKKSGRTNIKIEIFDEKEQIKKTINYQILINNNLELLYDKIE